MKIDTPDELKVQCVHTLEFQERTAPILVTSSSQETKTEFAENSYKSKNSCLYIAVMNIVFKLV